MGWLALNVLLSASIISIATWLSARWPGTAGFVTALPLSTMLVMLLSRVQQGDAVQSTKLATSILVAVPISALFLVPFLLAPKLQLGFWTSYASGAVLLSAGYFIHRAVIGTS